MDEPGRVHRLLPWLRLVLVAGVGLVVTLVALIAFGLQVAGGSFGWVIGVAAFAPLGAATAWLAVSGRWSIARRRAIIGAAATWAILGVVMAHVAPPTFGRLRATIVDLEQESWMLVDDSTYGNAICLDTCNTVVRTYRIDASIERARDLLTRELPGSGWRAAGFGDSVERTRDDMRIRVDLRDLGARTEITVTAEAR